MRKRYFYNFILCAILLAAALALSGCGEAPAAASEPEPAASERDEPAAEPIEQENLVSPTPAIAAPTPAPPGGAQFVAPAFLEAAFDDAAAEGNDEVQVDLSSVNEGYVALFCESDARNKLQVFHGEEKYVYDVAQGVPQIYPLQMGDGLYTFKVMKNLEDSKYFELYQCQAEVTLLDEFQPFLRPSKYADYSAASACVKKAAELAGTSADVNDFITRVYEFVCANVTYDYDKAASVASGYMPDPDSTLAEKKGICFDYASLAASMLRSQGVPTKLIFGYVAPDDVYHAWNMYYTEESGWVAMEFQVGANAWNRIDMTFAANGADSSFIGDGSNYLDVYQY